MKDDDKDFGDSDEFDDFGFSEDENDSLDGDQEEYSQSFGAEDDSFGGGNEANDMTEDFDSANSYESGMDEGMPSAASAAKNNLLYIVIGAVILLPIVYKFIGGSSEEPSVPVAAQTQPKAEPKKPTKVVKEEPKKTPAGHETSGTDLAAELNTPPTGGSLQQPVATPVQHAGMSEEQIKMLEDKLKDMTDRLKSVESSLKSLNEFQTDLSDLKQSLNSDNQVVKSNQKKVDEISKSITSLNSNVEKMTKSLYQQVLSLSKDRVTKEAQKQDFVVMASIQTRAWLRNKDGVLITVREGQTIPGYGKVKRIDPVRGRVIMNDNTVFVEEAKTIKLPN